MFKYCLDTSGLSNPVLDMPKNIYVSLWPQIIDKVAAGVFCWNVEISEELESIFGAVGDCLKSCNGNCCFEVGAGDWLWENYLEFNNQWQVQFQQYISEYNGDRKNTIGFNDLSIVALAKTLGLPVMSMEKRNTGLPSATKLRIPDLCDLVSVDHFSFNAFLEAEGITV